MKRLPVILLFLTCALIHAQVPARYEHSIFFEQADSNKVFIHIGNKNFFKNNEYFNKLNEGMTLPGVILEPTLVYHPGAKTRLEAGANMLKYFGRDGIFSTQPIIRFQYQPVSYFQMVMGSLYGGAEHKLIEPLYQWERTFTHPVEYGVQLLAQTPRISVDVWINWEKFIMQGDPFQEELTFGTVASYKLLPADKKFNISIPAQVMINHHGGQVNAVDSTPLMTIANYASGLKFMLHTDKKLIRKLNLDCWYIGYNDMSPQKLQEFKNGYALHSVAGIEVLDFTLQAGYMHCENYLSLFGEPLLQCALIPTNGTVFASRDIVPVKLFYSKKIDRGISLAVYAEVYKDLAQTDLDYNYGVHIIFDRDFFVKRVNGSLGSAR